MSQKTMVLDAGSAKRISVTLNPVGVNASVTWTASDPTVAHVVPSDNGKVLDVTAMSAGQCVLTADCMGMTGTCTVTVRPPQVVLPPAISQLGDGFQVRYGNWYNPLRTENGTRQYVLNDYTDSMNQSLLTFEGIYGTGWAPKDLIKGAFTGGGLDISAVMTLETDASGIRLKLNEDAEGFVWKRECARLGWPGFEWNVLFRIREDGCAIVIDVEAKNASS